MYTKILNLRQSNIFMKIILRKMSNEIQLKPTESLIWEKLKKSFQPTFIDVINESYMHNVPKGSETHFKIVIVSDRFNAKPLITRHRMVHDVLEAELQNIHALSIVAKTPEQWENSNQTITSSPACRGGFGK
ncbi:hypothetical protein KPH14_009968 [Odynerus spinipes]|uniref:BolA n=1 Tax=Odynerus spinipes TaxID=1348599 RepID=A0AAD9VSD1_9HYME|nr:hypothetical protein KPH14_009968 [Odynerus spinipes]